MPSYILSANRQSVQQDPYLFQLKNGDLLGLWTDLHPDPGIRGGFGVYGRAWRGDLGAAAITDTRINNLTNDTQQHPAGTPLTNGGFAVIFDSKGPSAINGYNDPYYDAYIKFFSADGAQRGAARQLTPNTTDDHRAIDIVSLANSQTITLVSRYEGAGEYDLLAYRHEASGRQIGGARELVSDADAFVNSITGSGFISPSIAAAAGGNYAVSWHERTTVGGGDGYGIWTQVYRMDGTALSPARLIAPNLGGREDRLDQSDGQLSGRSVGGFALAWERDEADAGFNTNVFVRMLNGSGVPVGKAVMVNSDRRAGEQELHDIVDLGSGRTLVTYINQIPDAIDNVFDGGVLLGRVFDPRGFALTSSFRISEGSPFESMSGGNTIINQKGQIVATFQAELTYQFDDDVILVTRGLTLPDIFSGAGNNRVQGTYVNDRLFGQQGNDRIAGDRGHDVLDGGIGRDTLLGQSGNDVLFGGSGNDELRGGDGRDRLVGNAGADQLYGGKGVDTFVFRSPADTPAGQGRDTIHDFQRGQDRIDLSQIDARIGVQGQQDLEFNGRMAAANSVWFTREGSNSVIRGDVNGNGRPDFVIQLNNVGQLSENDFIF